MEEKVKFEEQPSREELEKAVMEMSEQCRNMHVQLQQANMFNTFKHLDYLFKMLEFKDQFDPSLITKARDTICSIMFNEEDRG